MNPVARRVVFWLLTAVYAVGSIWWTLSVPHQPTDLMRAIPGHAEMVSMHDQLANRWDAVAAHPLTAILAGMFGGNPGEWKELRNDAGFRFILELIGERELALATVPFMGAHQESTLIFASWVGGKSQRLRWTYPFLKLNNLRRLDDISGWPVWTFTWEAEQEVHRLTFSLVEGMIIGTLARDPRAIELLIDAYNGAFPSIGVRRDLDIWLHALMHSEYHDRILYRQKTWPESRYWFAEMDVSNEARLSGVIRTDGDHAGSETNVVPPLEVTQLFNFWGRHAIAVGAIEAAHVVSMLNVDAGNIFSTLYREVVDASDAPVVALGLFGGTMSGRFKGIRVPTLMLGVQADGELDAAAQLHVLVDRWNARYRWGLVPVETRVGGRMVWRLEGTSDLPYSTFLPTEQVAVTVEGDWIVVSSNFKGLETLILTESGGDTGTAHQAGWTDAVASSTGEPFGYFGMDLVRGSETLRLAITAYSLKLLFENAEGSREQRQKLNEAKAWLELLATFGNIHVIASREPSLYKMAIESGN